MRKSNIIPCRNCRATGAHFGIPGTVGGFHKDMSCFNERLNLESFRGVKSRGPYEVITIKQHGAKRLHCLKRQEKLPHSAIWEVGSIGHLWPKPCQILCLKAGPYSGSSL